MNPRFLPFLNLIGCLALTALVVVQWRRERSLDGVLADLRSQIAAAHHQAEEDAGRRTALERDIAVLKESIEATQKAAESAARELDCKQQEIASLQIGNAAALDQLAAWEAAVKQRDERIITLNEELAKTRQRLDEAVKRIKEVGQ